MSTSTDTAPSTALRPGVPTGRRRRAASALRRAAALLLAGGLLASVAACGPSHSSSRRLPADPPARDRPVTVTVGVAPGPYGEMIDEVIAPLLKDDGYRLVTRQFNDYVQPNRALASGSIQADLTQHANYLRKFDADNHLDLTALGQVPTLVLGIYSHRFRSVGDIADGASVAVPNDGSNLARALDVLAQQGLVTIRRGVDPTRATAGDIASNPRHLDIRPLDAVQLARSLDTVDVALVPGNYAWAAHLDSGRAIAMERPSAGVINVIAVAGRDRDSDFARKVRALLVSDGFRRAVAGSRFRDFARPTDW